MILDLGGFTRRGLLVDRMSCRHLEGIEHSEGRGCKTRNEVEEDTVTTDQSVMVK